MNKCEHDTLQEQYIKSWLSNYSETTATLWEQLQQTLTDEQQTKLYTKAVCYANEQNKKAGSDFRYVIGDNTEF